MDKPNDFTRGAEAMRQACVRILEEYEDKMEVRADHAEKHQQFDARTLRGQADAFREAVVLVQTVQIPN